MGGGGGGREGGGGEGADCNVVIIEQAGVADCSESQTLNNEHGHSVVRLVTDNSDTSVRRLI